MQGSQSPQRLGLPPALLWALAFGAVIAHLPALSGFFAQDDWTHLARGAGLVSTAALPARPVSSVLYWKLLWPLLHLSSPAYHGLSLLLWMTCVLLAARVGVRLGLRASGAAIAGLVVAGTPVAILPLFWVSASSEILACGLALAAVDRWLAGGRRNGIAAAVLAGLAALSKESALGLPLLLGALALRGEAGVRAGRTRRLLVACVAAPAAVACAAGLLVAHALPHGLHDAYALGGPATVLRNLGVFGGWLVSPWRFALFYSPLLPWVGALVWGLWSFAALRAWRAGERLGGLALWWALLVVAPTLGLLSHVYPYYLLLAVPAWGWMLGLLLQGPAEQLLAALATPAAPKAATPAAPKASPTTLAAQAVALVALLVAAGATASLGWSATQATLTTRTSEGLQAEPIAARASIAAGVARQVRGLRLLGTSRLAILQATTVEVPDTLRLRDRGVVIAGSLVYGAMDGAVGFSLLVPRGAKVQWTSHLDDLPGDTVVLLDAGDAFLRMLGDVTNARLYSALIAVAAGQFTRARHDLWTVSELGGGPVTFAYNAQKLPIPLQHLDDAAPAFEAMLRQEGSPASYRVLNLFQQLARAVRGRPAPAAGDSLSPSATPATGAAAPAGGG